jgi:hypothetical protein
MGSVSKSYMKKGFLIYEQLGKYLDTFDEAVIVIYDFATESVLISLHMGKIFFSFSSVRVNDKTVANVADKLV